MAEEQEVKRLLCPGEIKLSWCSRDWPLTALGAKKNPYLPGWQNNPMTIEEIQLEMVNGNCKAVGLIAGPCFNLNYGLVWVDVDGPSVHELVESLSHVKYSSALPPTLTICSGKEGRERRLYKVSRENQELFARNKYIWRAKEEGEKLEILWRNVQGALMGLHPDTEGYYTPEGLGFEWADKIPEVPRWILECVNDKNVRQGLPLIHTTTVAGPTFTIRLEKNVERDIQVAVDALWAFPSELADDYTTWIKIGQCLHTIDDCLLEQWDAWSQQSDKYKPNCCHDKWSTFRNDGGGVGLGTLLYMHKEFGTGFSIGPEENDFFGVPDESLEVLEQQFEEMQEAMQYSFAATQVLHQQIEQQQYQLNEIADSLDLSDFIPNSNTELDAELMGFGGKKSAPRNPPESKIFELVCEMMNDEMQYNTVEERFYQYGYTSPGVWSPIYDIDSKGIIANCIKNLDLPRGYTASLVSGVHTLFCQQYRRMKWNLCEGYLNFKNGMLNVNTMEFVPHNKEYYSTSQLPYEYNPVADCPKIKAWLNFTQWDDSCRVELLRAWLRAVLLSRPELQVFLELIGAANAGKSSFANLCSALVGFENTFATNLDQLETNKFEPAGAYDKKLITMADASRYGGKVVVLKQLLGQDPIQLEKKYMREKHQFYFGGMIITTANEPIQTTDLTSGMLRRRITVPFTRQFRGAPSEYKTLINFTNMGKPYGEFADELPGLVNWLLDMDEDTMQDYLKNPSNRVPYIATIRAEQIIENNPIMEWLDAKVVFEPSTMTWLGDKKEGSGKDYYANTDSYLYASYCDYCRKCNMKEIGRRRFIVLLADICKDQLRINIERITTKQRWLAFKGLALRISNPRFAEYPSIVEYSLNSDKYSYIYGEVVDVESVAAEDHPLLAPVQKTDPYPESLF